MFKRILIANRGEIACRIITTCRRLGIETVAVHSEADRAARHVRMADRAIAIGPAEASASYLRIERIVEAAVSSGTEAVHPGYGFLSENPDFARALEARGIVLIGPRADTIEAMGSKARAKAIMERAGVPLVPGYHGDAQDDDSLHAEAARVGFPLMLKAAAGGGGKGMRVVRSAEQFAEALAAARREAQAAFGDQRMILERYVERPRHIEAQVFGDAHGNVVHLFERDCSAQRRHQKVIEEAPAAGLDPDLRQQLLEAAVQAARAVDYLGAGTVEFLVDEAGFYFLEMNTRLQVEHPVTERVTGLDLVEWQLRIAAGEPLPLAQHDIPCRGHAIEARIYAEDPERGFLPGSGIVRQLRWPDGAGVRIDTGIEAGDAVSIHYDPMIAKLIVDGPDRDSALLRLKQALADSEVAGLTTNLGFLLQLAEREEFATATLDTGFLDRDLAAVLDSEAAAPAAVWAAAALWWLAQEPAGAAAADPSPWAVMDGWRPGGREAYRIDLEAGPQRLVLHCSDDGSGGWRITLDGHEHHALLQPAGAPTWSLTLGQDSCRIQLHPDGERIEVAHDHRRWTVRRHRRFEAIEQGAGGSGRVAAPMPGKIIQVLVADGDKVEAGQPLLLMEAMKMELTLRAEIDGTIERVHARADTLVEAETVLIEIG